MIWRNFSWVTVNFSFFHTTVNIDLTEKYADRQYAVFFNVVQKFREIEILECNAATNNFLSCIDTSQKDKTFAITFSSVQLLIWVNVDLYLCRPVPRSAKDFPPEDWSFLSEIRGRRPRIEDRNDQSEGGKSFADQGTGLKRHSH